MIQLNKRLLVMGTSLLLILACAFQIPAPTPDPGAVQTAVAGTIAVAFPSATGSPVPFATLPSITPSFTPSPTVSLTPFSLLTVTPSVPTLTVTVDTNCRTGPGKIYDRIGYLLVGEVAEVIAKDPSGLFYYIRNPDNPNGYCWVTGQYAVVSGNVSVLPIYTPLPTPTPSPAFEVSFKSLQHCGSSWWINFLLKNTGTSFFESVSLSVKDMVTGVTVTTQSNEFLSNTGCSKSHAIDDLDPGESHEVSSPAFSADPHSHKMKATITVCTKDDLEGVCLLQTINFKP